MPDFNDRRAGVQEWRTQPVQPSTHSFRVRQALTTNLGPTVRLETEDPRGNRYEDVFIKHVHANDPSLRVWTHSYRTGAYDVKYDVPGAPKFNAGDRSTYTQTAPAAPAMQRHLDQLHAQHAKPPRGRR